jgi:hypothetical protein
VVSLTGILSDRLTGGGSSITIELPTAFYRGDTMYSVRVLWTPAYELLASLVAAVSNKAYRSIDMGRAWRESALKSLPDDILALVSERPAS